MQVAGHLFEEGKAGSLVDDFGHFYKPIQPGPRGNRERKFYEAIRSAREKDKLSWVNGDWSDEAKSILTEIGQGVPIMKALLVYKQSKCQMQSMPATVNECDELSLLAKNIELKPTADNAGKMGTPIRKSLLPAKLTSPIVAHFANSPQRSGFQMHLPSSNSTKRGGNFPTFRLDASFMTGTKKAERDAMEILERDELGLIDEEVIEELLKWSDDESGGDHEGELSAKEGEENVKSCKIEESSSTVCEEIGSSRHIQMNNPKPRRSENQQIKDTDNRTQSLKYATSKPNGFLHYQESLDEIDDGLSRSPDSEDGMDHQTGSAMMDGIQKAFLSASLPNNAQSSSDNVDEAACKSSIQCQDLMLKESGLSDFSEGLKGGISSPTKEAHQEKSTMGDQISEIEEPETDAVASLLGQPTFSILKQSRRSKNKIAEDAVASAAAEYEENAELIHRMESKPYEKHLAQDNHTRTSSKGTDRKDDWMALYNLPFSLRNAPLLQVIPKFYGVREADGRILLELEDLARYYMNPSIVDIKIGRRTWYPGADSSYIERCANKDASTTQSSLGFKICGMQVYRHSRGGYWRASKRWCKKLPEPLIDNALLSFVHNGHGLKASDIYGGPTGAVAQLNELLSWFQHQNEFHFYSASVLIMYEGNAQNAKEANVRVRFVDFAHTFPTWSPMSSFCADMLSSNHLDANFEADLADDQSVPTLEGVPLPPRQLDKNFIDGLTSLMLRLGAVSRIEIPDTLG